MMPKQHPVKSDWLFNTQLVQEDCLILEIYMKATWNINAPYFKLIIQGSL